MTEHNFEQMRRAMVSNSLRTTGVNDPRIADSGGAQLARHHRAAHVLEIVLGHYGALFAQLS